MTETATETTDASETGATTENDDQGRDNDGAAMAKALKKANKEAETLRLRVKEFEDATKTEQDKLTERTAKAEKAAADAHRDYLRLKVGTAKGSTPSSRNGSAATTRPRWPPMPTGSLRLSDRRPPAVSTLARKTPPHRAATTSSPQRFERSAAARSHGTAPGTGRTAVPEHHDP